jgi:hypothetical protein
MKKAILDQVRKLSAKDHPAQLEQESAKASTAVLQAIQTARRSTDDFRTYTYAATPEQAQHAIEVDERPSGLLKGARVEPVQVTFSGGTRFAITIVDVWREANTFPTWIPLHALDVPPAEILRADGCSCELHYGARER